MINRNFSDMRQLLTDDGVRKVLANIFYGITFSRK